MRYSKNQIEKAGFNLINNDLVEDQLIMDQTMSILTYWRDSHISSLDKCERLLKDKVTKIDNTAYIAKRMKRTESIIKKLKRFKNMSLKNMQDIGGMRVVLSNEKKVKRLFNLLSRDIEFLYENGIKFKNYIENPKEDGYRGIHIIGKFNNLSKESRSIEVQLRTKLQHCWATSLEIIDLFTQQNLKLNEGRPEWHQFFKFVSNQFRILENLKYFDSKNPSELLNEYVNILIKPENKIFLNEAIYINNFVTQHISGTNYTIESLFKEYAKSLNAINEKILKTNSNFGYVLLRLNVLNGELNFELFERNNYLEASARYSLYEKTLAKNKSWVVALVSTNAVGGIKEAYPNYFADSNVFWSYIALIKLGAFICFNKHKALSQIQ